jgi:hypothetical protein
VGCGDIIYSFPTYNLHTVNIYYDFYSKWLIFGEFEFSQNAVNKKAANNSTSGIWWDVESSITFLIFCVLIEFESPEVLHEVKRVYQEK